ncbi:peptidase U62 modulator of DNA gyrase [Dehalococcoides mccartyi CG4]|uniref:TldD/PmbA family protein n=1 Tax=Dehalococcoides mccartyi TaxID=61435 RepID=UPI0004E0635B|nr:TldD/PmbA family protein [Dehalococcoides mccartyi]AII59210.1 peptidase U62 modulator of DNA gyrase [Dehalococcoides mccartyi CG4]
MLEKIIEQAKKVAEQAECFMVESESAPIHFEANQLKNIESKQSLSLALRIIKDGKIGYAASSNPANWPKLADMALETAAYGQTARFQFPAAQICPEVKIFDPEVETVSLEEMVKLGKDMITGLLEINPDLVCSASLAKSTLRIRLLNTSGADISYKKSHFSMGLEGTLVRGTDMLFVGDGLSSCHPIRSGSEVVNLVGKQLERASRNVTLQSGEMPVIFTPHGISSTIIPALSAALNGKLVQEKASPLAGKLGEQMFDPAFSLVDDPTQSFSPNSRPFDDEGTASQITPMVENGVIKNFIYDLRTAALAKAKSTGNAERHGGQPAPGFSALMIKPGTVSFEEMVSGIKEGLIVEFMMGAEQGNVLGGDFSGNVLLGYKIENGQIAGRVKDTMLSGNIYNALKTINAIGSDGRWLDGELFSPSIYFPKLSVAAK